MPSSTWRGSILVLGSVVALGCVGSPSASPGKVVPTYNRETGKLTYVDVDRNEDGKFEARAFMDGTWIQRIEVDENADGKPERWEYYSPAGTSGAGAATVIVRAEEASETTGKVCRWEYYEGGQIVRVDEDVDEDGRVDKWEKYRAGRVASIELDLTGSGKPERRIVYHADGSVSSQLLSEISVNSRATGS